MRASAIAGVVLLAACDGAGTSTPPSSVDAAASDAESGTANDASAGGCRIERLDDPNRSTSGGPSGCTQASDCTVRYTGDGCCPTEPQAMTTSAATSFDEGLNGVTAACGDRCQSMFCEKKPEATAQCLDGGCSL